VDSVKLRLLYATAKSGFSATLCRNLERLFEAAKFCMALPQGESVGIVGIERDCLVELASARLRRPGVRQRNAAMPMGSDIGLLSSAEAIRVRRRRTRRVRR
jgi:hypothetical protein